MLIHEDRSQLQVHASRIPLKPPNVYHGIVQGWIQVVRLQKGQTVQSQVILVWKKVPRTLTNRVCFLCNIGDIILHDESDCLSPTHMCKRNGECSAWQPVSESEAAGGGPFECEKKPSQCTVVNEEAVVTTTLPPTATTGAPPPPPASTECGLTCPNCFVPSADCRACIPDTSMAPEDASQCDPCINLPDDYCGSMFGLPSSYKWYARRLVGVEKPQQDRFWFRENAMAEQLPDSFDVTPLLFLVIVAGHRLRVDRNGCQTGDSGQPVSPSFVLPPVRRIVIRRKGEYAPLTVPSSLRIHLETILTSSLSRNVLDSRLSRCKMIGRNEVGSMQMFDGMVWYAACRMRRRLLHKVQYNE